LIGLNRSLEDSEEEEIKGRTLYSILQDFPVFNDLKAVNTTVISASEEASGDDEDQEEKKDEEPKLSPF
jgi:hypothetical protein